MRESASGLTHSETEDAFSFGHIHEAGGAKVVDWKSEEGITSQQEEKELAYPPYESEIPNMFSEPIQFSIVHGWQSLMINAIIMDHTYRLRNAPWLVDLELPHIS